MGKLQLHRRKNISIYIKYHQSAKKYGDMTFSPYCSTTTKVRISLASEDILVDSRNLKGLFEGQGLVLGLGIELGLGQLGW